MCPQPWPPAGGRLSPGLGLGVGSGLRPRWSLRPRPPPASRCQIQKRRSSGSMDDRPSLSARDYVEALHQSSRATLLYGKNNVLVQPVRIPASGPGLPLRVWLQLQRRGVPVAPGCSSIHPSIHSLIRLFVHLPISPSLHLFTRRMVFPSIHSSIHSSVSVPPSQPVNSLPASVFTHPSVHASIHHFLSICLYLYLSSHLSIHPSLSPSLRPPIHPSILLPIITSTHQSSIHPSLTSTCPFVHLFSSPSTHYLSTQLSYLSFSLIITHSLSSLICAGPALHRVRRISR